MKTTANEFAAMAARADTMANRIADSMEAFPPLYTAISPRLARYRAATAMARAMYEEADAAREKEAAVRELIAALDAIDTAAMAEAGRVADADPFGGVDPAAEERYRLLMAVSTAADTFRAELVDEVLAAEARTDVDLREAEELASLGY